MYIKNIQMRIYLKTCHLSSNFVLMLKVKKAKVQLFAELLEKALEKYWYGHIYYCIG